MFVISASLACGGFFCDGGPTGVVPVLQTSENIAFGVADGTVEMHVQVAYEGPPDEFAWVLPVPAEPEIFRTTAALFRGIEPPTRLTTRVVEQDIGCGSETDTDADADADSDVDTDVDVDTGLPEIPGVHVISRQQVGPYDTVVLEAENSNVLVGWLATAGFNTPPGLADTLAPYGGPSTRYVALRLLPDREVADIEPFALRYPGDLASIPIRLTSVAAVPDMPVTVYMIGPHRAVPSNYLHVELNPFAMNWRQPDQGALIARAADEAGGQAFATISATQASRRLAGVDLDLVTLATEPDLGAWLTRVIATQGFTAAELARVVALPAEVDPTAFFSCPSCFDGEVDFASYDIAALTTAFEAELMVPLRNAQGLLDRGPWTTRMQSSVSPAEMTVDPSFVFAPSLPFISPVRTLTLTRTCTASVGRNDAAYRLEAGGIALTAPSQNELEAAGHTDVFAWLAASQDTATLRIAQGSVDGLSPMVDNEERIVAEVGADDPTPEDGPRDELEVMACGCATGSPAGGLFGLALLAMVLRRRG